MARYGMVIDTRKCVGCMDCVVACETENDVPIGFSRDWITTRGPRHLPRPLDGRSLGALQPLREPAVRDLLPDGASHVSELGIVKVTANRCIGCKACISACPYGARYVQPEGLCRTSARSATTASRTARIRPAYRCARRLHVFRRPGRSEEHCRLLLRTASGTTLLARGRNAAAGLLPDVRSASHAGKSRVLAATRASTCAARLGLGDSAVPLVGGLVAGMMVLAGVAMLRTAGAKTPSPSSRSRRRCSASCWLNLGMLALLLDLAHPLYVWAIYIRFQPLSPMSWAPGCC